MRRTDLRDIVSGINDADAAVAVLERALAEAETTRRPLRAATMWAMPQMIGDMYGSGYAGAYLPSADLARAATEQGADLLDKALHARTSELPVTATSEAHEGEPGRMLVRLSLDAGLVVIGARSHGALTSALLGSATGYVLHHSDCPVMVVPESASPGRFRRVVVGIDGGTCSHSALRWGADAAARHHCPLLVIHATNVLPAPGGEDVFPDYARAARTWLPAEVSTVVPATNDAAVTSKAIEGPASRVLLDTAGPDDLLVIGSRGRGGFVDMILGSVAMQCATHSRGPVVVVRAGHERLIDGSAARRPG
jgi:nucleotide-binding universal stress UspA family protein